METPSYIAKNQDELFESSSQDIQDLILNGDVESATAEIITKYTIKAGVQTSLSDVISFTLIGALQPDDVVQALQDLVEVDGETAIKIATDLESGILEKAHITLMKKSKGEVKTLEFQGEKSKDELRKELLDTTKRESGFEKSQANSSIKKTSVLTPGSRSQLLEQLQVLGSIPNDEEIAARLSHIQEQISSMKKQEDTNTLDSKIALKSFMFGEKGKEIANPTIKHATYSVAPTAYNVDPYKEIAE